MISIMWFALGIAATLAVLTLCAKSYEMGIKEGQKVKNHDL